MAFDEGLAERVRNVLEEHRGVSEKKMFGGVCFLLDGKMCVGVTDDRLMVRVGAEDHARALERPHVKPMDFTGTPLKGFVFVEPEGIDFDAELEGWIAQGIAVAKATLAAEQQKKKKPARLKAAVKKHARPARARARRRAH